MQVPPHPSLAPHALLVQDGTQEHALLMQLQPLAHAAHARPPEPQALVTFPNSQPLALQQPLAQETASHWQLPEMQRWPGEQVPF